MSENDRFPEPPAVVLFGIPFHNVSFTDAVEWAMDRMRRHQPSNIATVNMDFVMQAWRDPEMQRILIEADLVIADGMPIVWCSPLFGPRLKERVTGSDITPMLAEAARDNGFSIFNLGAAPGVAEKAAEVLKARYPGLKVAGCYSPPLADLLDMDHDEILQQLKDTKPDLLLVAFGAPKQDKWINMHMNQWDVPVAIGIGGTLDFLAGVQKRAPRFYQKVGLEWLYRMFSNPRRLVKRYLGNMWFLITASISIARVRFSSDRPHPHMGNLPQDIDAATPLNAKVAAFIPSEHHQATPDFPGQLMQEAAHQSIILDMSAVTWLNSLDMGNILELAKACRKSDHRLFLACTRKRVYRIMKLCRVTEYVEVVDTMEGLIEDLETLSASTRTGYVSKETEQGGVFRLPMELTAATLPEVKNAFEKEWSQFSDEGVKELTIDGAEMKFLDSAAMGYLVALKKREKTDNIRVRLVNFTGSPLRTLKIAKLESLLEE